MCICVKMKNVREIVKYIVDELNKTLIGKIIWRCWLTLFLPISLLIVYINPINGDSISFSGFILMFVIGIILDTLRYFIEKK